MGEESKRISRSILHDRSVQAERMRIDWREWTAAFADIGTFIPFIVAYISVLKMDPVGILFAFGVALIACGLVYRTPFPVQPMKAIGAVAVSQVGMITAGAVIAASLVTGAVWLLLAMTGVAGRLARIIPRSVVVGVMLGLALSFVLQGIRMMSADWLAAIAALAIAILLRKSRLFPAMIVLLVGGVAWGALRHPDLWQQGRFVFEWRLPAFALHELRWSDVVAGTLLLALPQVPLTLGNAVIGVNEENNRLFPDRPSSVSKIAMTTGVMNLAGGAIGGVPMCHGAGGMAAYTAFGARTAGAPVVFGVTLLLLAVCFGGSIEFLLQAVPGAILGAILAIAGWQLAAGNLPRTSNPKIWLPVLLTAAVSAWNVAIGLLAGLVIHWICERMVRA